MARARSAKEKIASDPALIAKIRADIERWRPGLWAEEVAYSAACLCGAGERTLLAARALGAGNPTGECQRHSRKTE